MTPRSEDSEAAMPQEYKAYFQVIPRGRRAKPLVSTIRRCSKQFKVHYFANNVEKMQSTSTQAWEAMTNLFEVLRNEQDHGHLGDSFMTRPTAFIVEGVTHAEQVSMIFKRKIDKSHLSYSDLNLRNTLNKIAHYDTAIATFRINRRGSHYLILGGSFRGSHWVAEILVSRLCSNAAAAVKAIT